MDFRVLDVDDAPRIKKVAMNSRYGSSPTIAVTEEYHRSWIRNSEHTGYVFGEFDGDELKSVVLTTVSTGTVCWYASLVFTDVNQPFPYDLLRFANLFYLEKGYKRFMIGSPSKFQPSMLGNDDGLSYITEISLPPNTRPKYGELWENVMMKELHQETYNIYHFFETR